MGYKFSFIICCFAFSQMLSGQNMPVPYLNETIDAEGRAHLGDQILILDDGYIVEDESFCNTTDYSQCTNLTKIDFEGNIIWNTQISGELSLGSFKAFLDNSDNIIVLGIETRAENGSNDSYKIPHVFKFDNDGNLIWEQSFTFNEERNYYFLDGLQLENGDYIFVGRRVLNETILEEIDRLSIVRTDSLGEMLWEKTFAHSKSFISSPPNEVMDSLYKTYEIKDLVDTVYYYTFPVSSAASVSLDYDGNLIIGGTLVEFGKIIDNGSTITRKAYPYPMLFKATTHGDSLWIKRWGKDKFYYQTVKHVIPIPPEKGGGYIFHSRIERDTIDNEATHFYWEDQLPYVIRVDSNLNTLWIKYFEGTDPYYALNRIFSLSSSINKEYIYGAGVKNNINGTLLDISPATELPWVFKMNLDGEIIWERQLIDRERPITNLGITLFDLKEAENGVLVGTGTIWESIPHPITGEPFDDAFAWLFTLDENGCHTGPCEDEVAFLPVEQVPFDFIENSENILVYPNPATTSVTFAYNIEKQETVFLYNSLGQLIQEIELSPSSNSQTIATANFSAGIYYWQLGNQNGKLVVTVGK